MISVVIPTYNSQKLLLRCLGALESAKKPKHGFEVIVVDDGSTDQTAEILKQYAQKSRLDLSWYTKMNEGPGPARNLAIDHSKGDIIAFTDADCIPDADWLVVIEYEFLSNGTALIGGKIFCGDTLLFPWVIAPAGHVKVTANLAYSKKIIGDVRFDRKFLGFLGQDTDFVFRLEDKGYTFKYVEGMKITHPANRLGVRGVKRRAISRSNEVQLFSLYGDRALESVHPVFRPLIIRHFSPSGILTTLFLAGSVVLIARGYFLWLIFLVAFTSILFIVYGYRLFVTNMQKNNSISFKDKLRTLAMLSYYMPIFIYARILGSMKYRKIFV